jgi:hypothetical protein
MLRAVQKSSGHLGSIQALIGHPNHIAEAGISWQPLFGNHVIKVGRTLLVIKGYFDDSQTEGKVWALAGYVGDQHHWDKFETGWTRALAKHCVPYFHMREMADPKGVYKKWHPVKEYQTEVADFFKDLIQAIKESNISGFGSLVRIADLGRFNSETGLKLEPYPLAAYGCAALIAEDYSHLPVKLMFDRVERVSSKLERAMEYVKSDTCYDGFERFVLAPLPDHRSSQEKTAL